MRRALAAAAALVVLAPPPVLAAERVALALDACLAGAIEVPALASLLRLELSASLHRPVVVVRGAEPGARWLVDLRCAAGADHLVLRLRRRRPPAELARPLDLSNTPEGERARALALAVTETVALVGGEAPSPRSSARGAASPAAETAPRVPTGSREPAKPPAREPPAALPAVPSPATSVRAPASPPRDASPSSVERSPPLPPPSSAAAPPSTAAVAPPSVAVPPSPAAAAPAPAAATPTEPPPAPAPSVAAAPPPGAVMTSGSATVPRQDPRMLRLTRGLAIGLGVATGVLVVIGAPLWGVGNNLQPPQSGLIASGASLTALGLAAAAGSAASVVLNLRERRRPLSLTALPLEGGGLIGLGGTF